MLSCVKEGIAPNPDHCYFQLGLILLTNFLSFHKFYLFLPISLRAQSHSRAEHRKGFCFTLTKMSYLVVRLLHDLVQIPENDICATTFLGCNNES